MTDIEVQDNAARSRFEALMDGQVAGYAEYEREPGRITFTHTVVQPEFEGKGIGGRLAVAALDSAVAAQEAIVPVCEFIVGYIQKHPEYVEYVDPAVRDRVQ